MSRLIVGENDLLTWCQNNGEWGQQLMEEWVGLDEYNNNIEISGVAKGSRKKVKWKCSKNHEWIAVVNDRTNYNPQKRTSCPYCSGKKIDETNNLLNWCDNNGEYGERLKKEWTGLDEKGVYWDIRDVHHGKNRARYLWRCTNGHEWYTAIVHRTLSKSGCPYCNTTGTSYIEQLLYHALCDIFSNCKNRYKAFTDEINNGIEYDIALIDENIYIEYSPSYTHSDKGDRDKYKEELCIKHGIRFIKINDHMIHDSYTGIDIEVSIDPVEMLEELLGILGKTVDGLNIEKIKEQAFRYSHGDIVDEKQLKTIYPRLVKEIHTELNKIDISKLTKGSHIELFWNCPNCNYGENGEWRSRVIDRTGKLSGCPACGYNWYHDKVLESKNSIAKQGYNDLGTLYPELVKEWHRDNIIKPFEIKPGSHKDIYWQCVKCGYGRDKEWFNSPHSRVGQRSGCPACGYNWYKASTGKPQNLKIVKPRNQALNLQNINY